MVMSGPRKGKPGCCQDDCKCTAAQNAGSENSASSLHCLNNAVTTIDGLAICRAVYLRLRWQIEHNTSSPVAEVTCVASQAFPALHLSTSLDTSNNLR